MTGRTLPARPGGAVPGPPLAAVLAACLLLTAPPAYGAACLPDEDFGLYAPGQAEYNSQTGRPYFRVAVNSSITGTPRNRTLSWSASGSDTRPALHWQYRSIELRWDEYTRADDVIGYVLQRRDAYYPMEANAAEPLLPATARSAIRPNHASSSKTWEILAVLEGGTAEDCQQINPWEWGRRPDGPVQKHRKSEVCKTVDTVTVECGSRITSGSYAGTLRTATTTWLGSTWEPGPAQLPYLPGKFDRESSWNPAVRAILKARRDAANPSVTLSASSTSVNTGGTVTFTATAAG